MWKWYGPKRRRYQKEEKKRGLRNKQKRNSNCSAQIDWDPIIGFGVVALGSITITAIVIDDTTVIGVADDGLIIPLLEMIRRGFDAMIR